MEKPAIDTGTSEIRKLAAIMFADMMGFTAMMQEDEAKAKTQRNHQQQTLAFCSLGADIPIARKLTGKRRNLLCAGVFDSDDVELEIAFLLQSLQQVLEASLGFSVKHSGQIADLTRRRREFR